MNAKLIRHKITEPDEPVQSEILPKSAASSSKIRHSSKTNGANTGAVNQQNGQASSEKYLLTLRQECQDLEYIFEMLAQLRKIAIQTNCRSLVYFLEMAALEAGENCDAVKFRMEALE